MAQTTAQIWSSQDVLELIKSVRHSPFLYNSKSPKYNDAQTIENKWNIISQYIGGKSAIDCRTKWDQLTSQLKRIEQSRQETNSTPNWIYYKSLAFLIPYLEISKKRPYSPDVTGPSSLNGVEPKTNHLDVPIKVAAISTFVASTPFVSVRNNQNPTVNKNLSEFDFPIDEPTQFLTPSSHPNNNEEQEPRASSPIMVDQNELNNHTSTDILINHASGSNDYFFKMISTEMNKLSNQEQSKFRIFVLNKLHEMLYSNN